MIPRSFSLLVASLFFFVGFARAQASAPASDVGVEVALVGLGELPSSVKIADGSRTLDVGVPVGGKGAAFRYRGPSPLVFFREEPDAEGKVRRVPVASAEFSPGWGKALVVLVATGRDAAGPRFVAQAFDDSAEGFPAGRARVFNFHAGTLALNNGGRVAQVPTRESRLVEFNLTGNRLWMKVALERAGRWEPLPAIVTQVAPSSRLLIFAYEERGDAARVERTYRTISEIVSADTLALR